jgi:hypothetical protein
MTYEQIAIQIDETCKRALENGQTIEINYRLPYVAINSGKDEYFFQDSAAVELIEEARLSKLHLYTSIENIILWQAQGW